MGSEMCIRDSAHKARLREAGGRTIADILATPLVTPLVTTSEYGAGRGSGGGAASAAVNGSAPLHMTPHFDLVKLDGDGPEGSWMGAIDKLLRRGRVSIDCIVAEGNGFTAEIMWRFQSVHRFAVRTRYVHATRTRTVNAHCLRLEPRGHCATRIVVTV